LTNLNQRSYSDSTLKPRFTELCDAWRLSITDINAIGRKQQKWQNFVNELAETIDICPVAHIPDYLKPSFDESSRYWCEILLLRSDRIDKNDLEQQRLRLVSQTLPQSNQKTDLFASSPAHRLSSPGLHSPTHPPSPGLRSPFYVPSPSGPPSLQASPFRPNQSMLLRSQGAVSALESARDTFQQKPTKEDALAASAAAVERLDQQLAVTQNSQIKKTKNINMVNDHAERAVALVKFANRTRARGEGGHQRFLHSIAYSRKEFLSHNKADL